MSRRARHEWILQRIRTFRRRPMPQRSTAASFPFYRRLQIEPLEARLMLSVNEALGGDVQPSWATLPDNVESHLANYYASVMRLGSSAGTAVDHADQPALLEVVGGQKSLLQLNDAGRPLVDIWTTG